MRGQLTGEREQRLISAAKDTFAERGYYATSISQIVQRAGVARATFYQHFDNKLHIFQSILGSFLEELQDCIRPIGLGLNAPSPPTQIKSNLTRVLDLVLKERALTQMLLHHPGGLEGTVQNHVDDFYGRVAAMIERSLALGITMKLVRPCNTRLVAHSIIGAVKEVVLRITSSQELQPQVEELVEELLHFGTLGILVEGQAYLLKENYWANRSDISSNPSVAGRPISSHPNI